MMNRPYVVVHQSASVDGRLTLASDTLLLHALERWQAAFGPTTDSMDRIKAIHKPEVILEGSGSFVLPDHVSDPLPPVTGDPIPLYDDFLPDSVVHRPGQRGWFTVVDSRGRIRWAYKEYPGEEWAGWHLLVLVARHTLPEYLAYLQRENIPYLVVGEDRVDLKCAMETLHAKLGAKCVLSEAGGKLNGALLRAGLVDEISIDFCPGIIGGFDVPSLFDSPALKAEDRPTRLKLISAEFRSDDHIWLRYDVAHSFEARGLTA